MEAKLCPFCGKEPRVWKDTYIPIIKYVCCENKECVLYIYNIYIEDWNKRYNKEEE